MSLTCRISIIVQFPLILYEYIANKYKLDVGRFNCIYTFLSNNFILRFWNVSYLVKNVFFNVVYLVMFAFVMIVFGNILILLNVLKMFLVGFVVCFCKDCSLVEQWFFATIIRYIWIKIRQTNYLLMSTCTLNVFK